MHALQEIRFLLRPGGSLIEIHPVPEGPLIEVRRHGRVLFATPTRSTLDEDELCAEEALAESVRGRLFGIEGSAEFDFLTYASSVAELRDFMAKESAHKEGPEDEAEEAAKAEVYSRVEQTWHAVGEGAEVARRERARIARLRPLWDRRERRSTNES